MLKVMNNVSRKSLDWHPYKTAGHPCSLACLIMICSLLDVKHKEHNWQNGFFCYSSLELQPQSAVKMLNVQTMCSSIFDGKITRGLLFTVCWSGQLCSCLDHDSPRRCCLWNEVMPTEGVPPPYSASLLCKRCIWFHCSQERGRWISTLL